MGLPAWRPRLECLLVAFLLVGCAEPEIREFRGTTMGTTYVVKYVGDLEIDEARAAVEAELVEFSSVFSAWISDSEVSRFNAHAVNTVFATSDALLEVVREALRIAELTDGAFDPTVMPLVRAYGFGPDGERGRGDQAEVDRARQRVGWQKLDATSAGLQKSVDGVELDLNAIAKGAGVDRMASLLADLGIASFMVEIGGEVFCAGEKGREMPWTIGVEDPADPRGVADAVPLRDLAMATSGSYRNWVEDGGSRVHHILDPRSGRNAENRVVSVSVIARTCMLADGLATAFMVLGPDEAQRVLNREPGVRALFLLAEEGGGLERREFGW